METPKKRVCPKIEYKKIFCYLKISLIKQISNDYNLGREKDAKQAFKVLTALSKFY